MPEQNRNDDTLDRLVGAYERMLERIHGTLLNAEQKTIPNLRRQIENARDKAVELGELTREEAERIGDYVQRDIRDAAGYLQQTGEDFGAWFRFDLELIEKRLLDMFANVADRTRVELTELAERARRASFYHTGEITGPGSLQCTTCGKQMHFHRAGHIPPCPGCRSTEFRRADDRD